MAKRCSRGSRKCFSSGRCVKKSSTRRTKKCARGTRQCANRKCYNKLRRSTRRR